MEAPYSASLGATGSLIKELDKIASTEEDGMMQKLRSDIGIIRTRLDKLSMIQDPPLMVNFWMKEARELSYNIENCVDQFGPTSYSDASMAWISQCSEFEDLVKRTIDRYERYNLHEYAPSSNTVGSFRLAAVYGEPEHVIHDRLRDLDQFFHESVKPKEDGTDRWQPKAVSILGVEGIGKSTLAKKLWRESDGKFQCRAFVQTAKKPNTRMILASILSQVRPEQPLAEVCKVTNLIHDLTEHLEDKRYFVVIDDLWSTSVWDIVKRAFPKGTFGSRIIITTAADDVAQACSSYDKSYVVHMEPLGDDESKKLFVDRIFGSEENCPLDLKDVSYEIIKNSGGLPLAIICLGTLVAQPKTEQQMDNVQDIKQQLDYVKNFLSNKLGRNSTSMEILNQVLKLCYSSLPHDLKTCLLYLSVYPENYVITKEDLVTQWIAEGFICTTDGKDIEEVAKIYFDELVSLGLIQRMDISNYNKKRLSYTVHPMVFDFITFRSMEDNFITIIDYSQFTVVLTDKIRRLALHFGSAIHATTPAGIGLLEVRSFAFMGLLSCMPSLVEFKLVRVMILHLQDDVGEFSLVGIKELLLLRYLQVRCSVTVTLPNKVQCLKHLETLEINAVVASAPSDIVNHPSLLHVFLGTKTKHKHLALDPVTSGEAKAIFLDVLSSSTSVLSPCVQVFKLLPPIISFSRLPGWIKQLSGLRVLEVMVGELSAHAPSLLGLLPALTDLSLYVRKPTASWHVVTKGYFPVLNYLKIVCGVISLSFWEGAVSNLRRLKIGFNAHRGDMYRDTLSGIKHLLKLEKIVASIGTATGAEESDRSAAVSALENAIGNHPCRSSFEVKKVGQIYEEYDPKSEIQSCTQSEIQPYAPSYKQPYAPSEIQPYTQGKKSSAAVPHVRHRSGFELPPAAGPLFGHTAESWAPCEIQPYTGDSTSKPPPPGDRDWATWKKPWIEKLQNTSFKPRHLTFTLLKNITNNFSPNNKVGRGGYGEVYEGVFDTGEKIAVKKLYLDIQGLDDAEFEKEFNNLMRVQHQNIIRLLGYCYEIQHEPIKRNGQYFFAQRIERALCFEYLQCGSLDKHLSDESCGLDWRTRFKIIKGVCEGLNYLHNGSEKHINHLDMKPANILLDENMTPKIADFGLSVLFEATRTYTAKQIIGTIRYMPPEYTEKGRISKKFDVFGLGVIIIEIIAGPSGYSEYDEMPPQQFAELVHEKWKKRFHTVSPHASYKADSLEVKMCIEMALRCVDADCTKRPTMAEVIDKLNEIETLKKITCSEVRV